MKIILDDGTEIPITTAKEADEVFRRLLDNIEALIETQEELIAARERETEAIRKRVFTLRRVYDAVAAAKDADERINHMFDPAPISREESDNGEE